MTSVNLKCVYGNMKPKDNPHELDDKIADKLIGLDLAEESTKKVDNLNAKLESELKSKDETIAKLESFVEIAIASAKDKPIQEWEEYKASKEA